MDVTCTSGGNTNPFLEALKNNFHSGGFNPLVFGAFGKTSGDMTSLIPGCARYAATQQESTYVTPLSTKMHHTTAFQVMLTQFR